MSHILLLRSNDAALNADGSYTFSFKHGLTGSYALVEAMLPNTNYNINSNNNLLQWTDTQARSARIAPNYYTENNLAAAVATAMNSVGSSITYTVSIDTDNTTAMSITGTGAFTLTFSRIPAGLQAATSLASILGFTNQDYLGILNGSTYTVTGPYPINMSWNNTYYIDLSRHSDLDTRVIYGDLSCNIVVPVIAGSNDLAVWTVPENQSRQRIAGLETSTTLTIRDDSGSVVNFQNANFYLKLVPLPALGEMPVTTGSLALIANEVLSRLQHR